MPCIICELQSALAGRALHWGFRATRWYEKITTMKCVREGSLWALLLAKEACDVHSVPKGTFLSLF